MPTPDFNKSSAHGAQRPVNGLRNDDIHPFFLMSGTGLGKASREKVGPTSDGGKWP